MPTTISTTPRSTLRITDERPEEGDSSKASGLNCPFILFLMIYLLYIVCVWLNITKWFLQIYSCIYLKTQSIYNYSCSNSNCHRLILFTGSIPVVVDMINSYVHTLITFFYYHHDLCTFHFFTEIELFFIERFRLVYICSILKINALLWTSGPRPWEDSYIFILLLPTPDSSYTECKTSHIFWN